MHDNHKNKGFPGAPGYHGVLVEVPNIHKNTSRPLWTVDFSGKMPVHLRKIVAGTEILCTEVAGSLLLPEVYVSSKHQSGAQCNRVPYKLKGGTRSGSHQLE